MISYCAHLPLLRIWHTNPLLQRIKCLQESFIFTLNRNLILCQMYSLSCRIYLSSEFSEVEITDNPQMKVTYINIFESMKYTDMYYLICIRSYLDAAYKNILICRKVCCVFLHKPFQWKIHPQENETYTKLISLDSFWVHSIDILEIMVL